jgi:polysaccharide chain length determinant protein (PEP-CTERM system associated)
MEVWSRRKWLGIVVFMLIAAAGVTIARSVPDIYQATATVLVQEPKAEAAVAGDLDRRLQVITQEILSRSRLEKLIYAFDLYALQRKRASPEVVVQMMRRDIRTEFKAPPVGAGPASTIAFELSYKSTRREKVAPVANALAALYLEEDVKIRGRQASEAVQVLKTQLDEMKGKLQSQERELGAFQEGHMGELPQQTEANMATLGQLQADLRSANEERMRALDRKNDLLRRLEEEPRAAGAAAAEPVTRLSRLKDQLADLRQRFSDKYPDVIRVKAEIAALEANVAETKPEALAPPESAPLRSRTALRLQQEVAGVEEAITNLRTNEASLRAQIAAHIARLENAPRRQRALQEISRDYETTRELYDSLRKRYEQASLAQDAEGAGPRFRVLDPAVVPSVPVAPDRMLLLVMAVAAAVGAAVGAVALAERLDTSFHGADDLASFTRVPVLTRIPLIVTARDRRARYGRFLLATASLLLCIGLVVQTFQRLARVEGGLIAMLAKGRS